MSYKACSDCGGRVYGGFCVNCDEEVFIANQYREDEESVPEIIMQGEREAYRRREIRQAIGE